MIPVSDIGWVALNSERIKLLPSNSYGKKRNRILNHIKEEFPMISNSTTPT